MTSQMRFNNIFSYCFAAFLLCDAGISLYLGFFVDMIHFMKYLYIFLGFGFLIVAIMLASPPSGVPWFLRRRKIEGGEFPTP